MFFFFGNFFLINSWECLIHSLICFWVISGEIKMVFQYVLFMWNAGWTQLYFSLSSTAKSGSHFTEIHVSGSSSGIRANIFPPVFITSVTSSNGKHSSTSGNEMQYSLKSSRFTNFAIISFSYIIDVFKSPFGGFRGLFLSGWYLESFFSFPNFLKLFSGLFISLLGVFNKFFKQHTGVTPQKYRGH